VRLLRKTLLTFAVALGVVAAYLGLGVLAHRWSLWALLLVALVVLPASYWRARNFRRRSIVLLVLAALLAASPVDVVFSRERGPDLRFAKASYGIACTSEACYACTVPFHPVRWAVVIAL
jgi:hypothetical protein